MTILFVMFKFNVDRNRSIDVHNMKNDGGQQKIKLKKELDDIELYRTLYVRTLA